MGHDIAAIDRRRIRSDDALADDVHGVAADFTELQHVADGIGAPRAVGRKHTHPAGIGVGKQPVDADSRRAHVDITDDGIADCSRIGHTELNQVEVASADSIFFQSGRDIAGSRQSDGHRIGVD
ncbi:hypothetical protein SDC9_164514 [bioreactor metagenome]|uniref:Uncharacterized protein n=1 Tax=bioreactor metagenome TaxID=1076179 RepID=A0A645FZ67_9ZZZZ